MDTIEKKVHEVLRCTKCKRMFKQAEQNEFNFCPKCLANTQNTVDAAEKIDESTKAEPSTTQDDVENVKEAIGEQFISDKHLQASELTTGDMEDIVEDSLRVEQQKNTTSEIKPGQYVREKFQELLNQNLITDERIAQMLDAEYSKKEMGFRYAFLVQFDSGKPLSEQNKIKGSVRYGSKVVNIHGREYLICNDIYRSTVPKFNKWLSEKFGK